MMKRMSFSETIFLFLLALIIFGPKKLPEIARQAGKLINEFRRASNEFKVQLEQEIAHIEVDKYRASLPSTTPPAGTANRTLQTLTPGAVALPLEKPAPEAPANSVDSNDEPLFASQGSNSAITQQTPLPTSQPASSASSSDSVTSSASQESHA
jgi:sec-independent protein translocase protein TatB